MKVNNHYNNKNMCCGCRACEQTCPVNAISMSVDNEGFTYPIIDENLCVDCGKCIKSCDFSKKIRIEKPQSPSAFVCVHKNDSVRNISRSGGVFVALSDYIFSLGGNVYGVELDQNFSARHAKAENPVQRDKFCGSKYVQSDTCNTFKSVYSDLISKKYVLYSGTACQIGGLYRYLENKGLNKESLDFLLTCDIVCHGVVSPKVWADNLEYIETKHNSKIQKVNFRDKSFGWSSHTESYLLADKNVQDNLYTSIFYEHVALRPSCYNCPYASIQRDADVTLADAWGIAKQFPDWNDDKGHSSILVNTDKGNFYFSKIKKDVKSVGVNIKDFMQPNLQRPTLLPANRDVFWKEYENKGYIYVAKKCKKRQIKINNKNKFKKFIVSILKKLKLK